MRALVQRVSRAEVRIDDRAVGAVGQGLVVLLAVRTGDTPAEAAWLADKVVNLRIFEGEGGKFDRSLADVGGALLVISQFTLYGDTHKGRRPNFGAAAPPDLAADLYDHFVAILRAGGTPVATGAFGARMAVEMVNDGPVTVMLEREARAMG